MLRRRGAGATLPSAAADEGQGQLSFLLYLVRGKEEGIFMMHPLNSVGDADRSCKRQSEWQRVG